MANPQHTAAESPLRLEFSRQLSRVPAIKPDAAPPLQVSASAMPVSQASAAASPASSPAAVVSQGSLPQPAHAPASASTAVRVQSTDSSPTSAAGASLLLEPAVLAGAATVLIAILGYLWMRRKSVEPDLPPSESVLWAEAPSVLAETKSGHTVSTRMMQGEFASSMTVSAPVPVSSELPSLRTSDFAPSTTGGRSWPQASMNDLHSLVGHLKPLLRMHDDVGVCKLLTRHIQTHSRTSPWVFYELFQVMTRLDRQSDWEAIRPIFHIQFGQVAPEWGKPLPARDLLGDAVLVKELTHLWPGSSTRTWIDRWMLGTGTEMGAGPPALSLEIYRELLWIDKFLSRMLRSVLLKQHEKNKSREPLGKPSATPSEVPPEPHKA